MTRRLVLREVELPRPDAVRKWASPTAVTHVDCAARVQTVHADTNPRFHSLIERFKAKTGCPVLANTSFNARSEPIVCTPEDAFRCFVARDIEKRRLLGGDVPSMA
jgi:predicted NodU family carbamoyl transferase